MCLLSYYPPQVMPDTHALSNGTYRNNDGHGYAIVTGNRILVRHSMDAEALIANFARARATHPHGPALFHSRFATHGTLGRHNCHPFRLGGDRRSVLAHNGILPKLVQPGEKDTRCDTRIAAHDFLPAHPFGHLNEPASRDRFAAWLGPHNKVVILTVNPAYHQRAYLINAEHGIWHNKAWYSNHDFRDITHTDAWITDGEDVCPGCRAFGTVNVASGYCQLCDTCFDCAEPSTECLCYLPETAHHRADLRDIQDNGEDEGGETPGALRHLVYDHPWS